jgi:hypothetical protein
MAIEYAGLQRPSRLALTTRMAQAEFSGTLTFEPAGAGTRLRWSWDARFTWPLRLLAPVLARVGGRQERATWAGLKRYLEPSPHPPRLRTGTAASRPGRAGRARRCWPRAWPGWRSPRLRCGGPAAAAACWWQPAAGRCSGAFVRSTAVRTWRSGYTFDAGRPPARRRRSGRASALAAAGTERRSWAAARTRPLAESRAVPDREGGVRRSRADQEVPWTVSC